MAKPDGLVASQTLSSERVQQVHLSLSHSEENIQNLGFCVFVLFKSELLFSAQHQMGTEIFWLHFYGAVIASISFICLLADVLHTWLRIPKKLYGLLGPGVRVASAQTKE